MIDDDHNLTSPIIDNNKNKDNENVLGIKKMQQNLIMMGFDIEMINKILFFITNSSIVKDKCITLQRYNNILFQLYYLPIIYITILPHFLVKKNIYFTL